jgi:hypothetical protein
VDCSLFHHFYRNLLILKTIFLFSSVTIALEMIQPQIPTVKEQVALYASIWKEMDSPQFDPKTTIVSMLAKPLQIANDYVRQAIGDNDVHLRYLNTGIQYLTDRPLTLQNFIIYNYYLAYLLTDLVLD